MEQENSYHFLCTVLIFRMAKIQWLVKEMLVFWSTGYPTVSIKLMLWVMNGCLILNKLVRRRVKLCWRVMTTLLCELSKHEHFHCFFPCPALTSLLLAPKLLGPGTQLTQNHLVWKMLNSKNKIRTHTTKTFLKLKGKTPPRTSGKCSCTCQYTAV